MHAILHYFETGNGYQFWSGIGSCAAYVTGPLIIVTHQLKHHNCHQKGCWRPGHAHPEHGWPSCKKHWNVTPDHIT